VRTKKPKLKLFVFPEYNPDWHNGLAFAIAIDAEDARQQLREKYSIGEPNFGSVQEFPLNKKIAFQINGAS